MPFVSVVVPHYGDPEPTLCLVRQLLDQAAAPAFEIIVSDDASPEPFPSVDGATVIRREVNRGSPKHWACECQMVVPSRGRASRSRCLANWSRSRKRMKQRWCV